MLIKMHTIKEDETPISDVLTSLSMEKDLLTGQKELHGLSPFTQAISSTRFAESAEIIWTKYESDVLINRDKDQILGQILTIAAYKGYTDLMNIALENGANTEFLSSEIGSAPVFSIGGKRNILHVLAAGGRPESLKFILNNEKFNIVKMLEYFDEDGLTPLHRAVFMNHILAVHALIDAGADIHIRDEEGKTPLHWACEWNSHFSLLALTKYDPDPNMKDDFGNPAWSPGLINSTSMKILSENLSRKFLI